MILNNNGKYLKNTELQEYILTNITQGTMDAQWTEYFFLEFITTFFCPEDMNKNLSTNINRLKTYVENAIIAVEKKDPGELRRFIMKYLTFTQEMLGEIKFMTTNNTHIMSNVHMLIKYFKTYQAYNQYYSKIFGEESTYKPTTDQLDSLVLTIINNTNRLLHNISVELIHMLEAKQTQLYSIQNHYSYYLKYLQSINLQHKILQNCVNILVTDQALKSSDLQALKQLYDVSTNPEMKAAIINLYIYNLTISNDYADTISVQYSSLYNFTNIVELIQEAKNILNS